MTRYAADTAVAPERSRGEIERILARYGASGFGYGWVDGKNAAVMFIAHGKHVRFGLPLPARTDEDIVYTPTRQRRSSSGVETAYDQAVRQRWRALVLCIKAKLEAVSSGITTFEDEFLAHIVLPSGQTTGEWLAPQLEEAYEKGKMPSAFVLALPAGDRS